MSDQATQEFYTAISPFHGFASLMDPGLYRPLPDDWSLGVADIVQSTKAIQDNRYKAVNTAGAAVIAAVKNAMGGRDLPFVFGGDGAGFAVAPADHALAAEALAATAAWVRDALDLTMRVALVPVAAIRAAGLDVRVARYAPSDNVTYAMFAGGGLGWAEAAMKRGEFAVAPAPTDTMPDLSGLSCRFEEIPAARGMILAAVILPVPGADPIAVRAVIEDIVALAEDSPQQASPLPARGLRLNWPPLGADLEARTRPSRRPLFLRKLSVLARALVYTLILRGGIKVGSFVPKTYLREVIENSDFRKFDDGLRMILDCPPALADAIEARLRRAAGTVRYGLHRERAAMMTCFTPSPTESSHVHFIDGASGGYAAAATALKQNG